MTTFIKRLVSIIVDENSDEEKVLIQLRKEYVPGQAPKYTPTLSNGLSIKEKKKDLSPELLSTLEEKGLEVIKTKKRQREEEDLVERVLKRFRKSACNDCVSYTRQLDIDSLHNDILKLEGDNKEEIDAKNKMILCHQQVIEGFKRPPVEGALCIKCKKPTCDTCLIAIQCEQWDQKEDDEYPDDGCNNAICYNCAYQHPTCNWCDRPVCLEHSQKCKHCDNYACNTCLNEGETHGERDYYSESDCHCAKCSSYMCKNHSYPAKYSKCYTCC